MLRAGRRRAEAGLEMKRTLPALVPLAASLLLVGSADAVRITTSHIEIGAEPSGSTPITSPTFDSQLTGVPGRTADAGGAGWQAGANGFASDAVFSRGPTSTRDLDTPPAADASFELPGLERRPVPGPGALALFLASFGVVGAVARRTARSWGRASRASAQST